MKSLVDLRSIFAGIKGEGYLRKIVKNIFIFVIGAICVPTLAWGEAFGPGQGMATTRVPAHAVKPDRVNLLLHIESGADRGPVRALTVRNGGVVRRIVLDQHVVDPVRRLVVQAERMPQFVGDDVGLQGRGLCCL